MLEATADVREAQSKISAPDESAGVRELLLLTSDLCAAFDKVCVLSQDRMLFFYGLWFCTW